MELKTYLITDIDPELKKDFKAACAYYNLSIKAVLINHMKSMVKDYKYAMSIFAKPKIYKDVKGKK